MRHLEAANSQRRKVDWGLPGAVRKGNGKLVFNADSLNTAGRRGLGWTVPMAVQQCDALSVTELCA